MRAQWIVGARLLLVVAIFSPSIAWGQPKNTEEAPADAASPAGIDEPREPMETEPSQEEPTRELRAPTLAMPDVGQEEGDAEPDSDQTLDASGESLSPGDAVDRLTRGGPMSSDSDPIQEQLWTHPQPIFTLHGYFRTRGEHFDGFWLGRSPVPGSLNGDPPFDRFRPIESRQDANVQGGCGSGSGGSAQCDSGALSFANMRLRLKPEFNLSEDVRVKAWIDVLDNVVLGSTPHGFAGSPSNGAVGTGAPYTDLQATSNTQLPPQDGRNSLQDSIVARRVWAEVRNRALGELRFGRMGFHWGLGLVNNGGEGLDADYSTDVDRVMGMTKLAGFYLMAAYDFAAEGYINQTQYGDLRGLPFDAGQEDDVDQVVFGVARRMEESEQKEALARGDFVLNAGVLFTYRQQFLSSEASRDALTDAEPLTAPTLVRRNWESFNPDVWVQFLYDKLRLELEASLVLGSVENTRSDSFAKENYKLLELGFAFESEYRLLDDKLGLFFNAGFASGDSDVEGLALTSGTSAQQGTPEGTDKTVSTFRFHPNYRIDLILWRNIMQQVAGAYYFKPGIGYDFIRDTFGQLLGARIDLIWSRASSPVQTWGNDPDLGVELNASVYYRSEDGPEVLDGFYAMAQYALLFPMGGLGYLPGQFPSGAPGLDNAFALRLLLGVVF
ncbi:MAG: TIGR04551 family protein [Myxococcales bacterium]|nr:TIGR04551 family protein [Myxococcales bacterium]MCB9708335.1 TIGR04551 family protein [Myxococcales bacterium]